MRLFHVVICFAALLGSGCSTTSSPSEPQSGDGDDLVAASDTAAGEPAAVVDDDPMVCERVAVTGTRVSQRVCRRQSVVEAGKQGAQEMLGEVQKRGALDTIRRE